MTSAGDGPSPVCLVPLVYLVYFVYFVGLVQPNKQDKPNKLNSGFLTLAEFFRIRLGKEIGRVSPGDFVKVEGTSPLLFRSIHGRVGMLQ